MKKDESSLRTVLGVVGEPLNGVSYVRFAQPFDHLGDEGFALRTLGRSLRLTLGNWGYQPEGSLLDGTALVMFPQMVASPVLADGNRVELLRSICEEASSRGIPIVYSADDYLAEIDPANPGYRRIRGSIDNLEHMKGHSSAVVVTTEPLARSLADWGKPVHLLPNTVDPQRWRNRPRASAERRVGWTGSSSHLDDLLMVLPAIRDLQRRVDFLFVLQGLSDMSFDEQVRQIKRHRRNFDRLERDRAERFLELVGQLGRVRYVHIPFGPVESFFDLLPSLDLDIGICPLVDTAFNRHKSANKFYEYAVTGSLTVASDVLPYSEEVSLTVPNERDAWTDTLERYLRDPGAGDAELERQREFVLHARTIQAWKTRWAEVLSTIIEQAIGEDPRLPNSARPAGSLRL